MNTFFRDPFCKKILDVPTFFDSAHEDLIFCNLGKIVHTHIEVEVTVTAFYSGVEGNGFFLAVDRIHLSLDSKLIICSTYDFIDPVDETDLTHGHTDGLHGSPCFSHGPGIPGRNIHRKPLCLGLVKAVDTIIDRFLYSSGKPPGIFLKIATKLIGIIYKIHHITVRNLTGLAAFPITFTVKAGFKDTVDSGI